MELADLLAAADASEAELLALWRDIIRIPTVNTGRMPTGDETPCAEHLAAALRADGVAAEVFESAPGRGSLLARLPGRGPGTVLWMAHLDVVPPGDETRWTHPPFAAEYVDGWVYGRGANDCKALAAAEVHALRLLARSGVTPVTVKLVCGADEESGGRYGFAAVAEARPDALTADLAINEGGGSPVTLADGSPGAVCAVGEKGRYEAVIRIEGRSEHASLPWLADNPLYTLGKVLRRLAGYRPEVVITDAAAEFLQRVWGVTTTAGELAALVAEKGGETARDVPRLLSLTRMTVTPTVTRAGGKSNAIPDGAALVCDVRALPHQGPAYAETELRRVLRGIAGVRVEVVPTALPSATTWTPALGTLLSEALAAAGTPGVSLVPTLCAGFTDARLVRPLGVPVVGFTPPPRDTPVERCGCHNIDEQFPLAAVASWVRFLLALSWQLAETPEALTPGPGGPGSRG